MLKHECPVAVAHGQSGAHWYRLPGGAFCVNLESMWDDFEDSADRFVEALQVDEKHCAEVLQRWRDRSRTVRRLPLRPSEGLHPSPTLYPGSVEVSASTATAMISVEPPISLK